MSTDDGAIPVWAGWPRSVTIQIRRPSKRLLASIFGARTPNSRRAQVPKLSIDGNAYHRRQRARQRRG